MKATIELEHSESGAVLQVSGELTAQIASAFRDKLMELLKSETTEKRKVSLCQVTSLDVSALQLLYAARATFSKEGKHLEITGPDDAGLANLISRTGFRKLLNF